MKRIIFVDDDPSIATIAKLLFERAGYEITVFANGAPLINNHNHIEAPDLYILDKQLPDIDGLEICRRLKSNEHTKHIPVIMLSANPDIKRLAKLAGADSAIEKPFSLAELRSIAKQYTEK
jgi:two-component system phosphate regulon response regulator PhoB/two-component system alkaline phosphatase synthesis response regulator PhoP